MSYAAVRAYLSSREIPQLFEALMAALMYHRPEDHLAYLQKCIHQIQTGSIQAPYQWNAFISEKIVLSESREILHVAPSLYHRDAKPILNQDKQKVIFVLSDSKETIAKVCNRVSAKKRDRVQFLQAEDFFRERMVVEGFGRWEVVPPAALVDGLARASASSDVTLVSGFPRHIADLKEWQSWSLVSTLVFLVPDEQDDRTDLEAQRNLANMFQFCSGDSKCNHLRVTAPEELHNILMEMSMENANIEKFCFSASPTKTDDLDYSVVMGMPVICFVGIPGSGKSSQSASAGHKFDMTRLNLEELVEKESRKLGGDVIEDSVSDADAIRILKREMARLALTTKGFILDDFPPTIQLGQLFEEEVAEFTVLLNLHVNMGIACKRYTMQAADKGETGEDEKEVRSCIESASEKLQPILKHFAPKVITVASGGSAAEIFGNVAHVIEGVLELPLEEEDVGPVLEDECVKDDARTIESSRKHHVDVLRKLESELSEGYAFEELEKYIEEVASEPSLGFEDMDNFESPSAKERDDSIIETPEKQTSIEPVEAAMFEISVPSFPSTDEPISFESAIEGIPKVDEEKVVRTISNIETGEPDFEGATDNDISAAEKNLLQSEEVVCEENSKLELNDLLKEEENIVNTPVAMNLEAGDKMGVLVQGYDNENQPEEAGDPDDPAPASETIPEEGEEGQPEEDQPVEEETATEEAIQGEEAVKEDEPALEEDPTAEEEAAVEEEPAAEEETPVEEEPAAEEETPAEEESAPEDDPVVEEEVPEIEGEPTVKEESAAEDEATTEETPGNTEETEEGEPVTEEQLVAEEAPTEEAEPATTEGEIEVQPEEESPEDQAGEEAETNEEEPVEDEPVEEEPIEPVNVDDEVQDEGTKDGEAVGTDELDPIEEPDETENAEEKTGGEQETENTEDPSAQEMPGEEASELEALTEDVEKLDEDNNEKDEAETIESEAAEPNEDDTEIKDVEVDENENEESKTEGEKEESSSA